MKSHSGKRGQDRPRQAHPELGDLPPKVAPDSREQADDQGKLAARVPGDLVSPSRGVDNMKFFSSKLENG